MLIKKDILIIEMSFSKSFYLMSINPVVYCNEFNLVFVESLKVESGQFSSNSL